MNIGKRPLIVLFCVCVAFSFLVASMSGCAKKASASIVQDVVCVDGQCDGVMQRSVSVNRNRVMRSRPIFKRRMIVVDGYQGSSEVVETVESVEEVPATEVVVSEMPVNTYERTVEVKVRRRLFKRRGFLFRRCR